MDILVTSKNKNGDRKIMQSIRIEPVLKNIYQSNTYRKDLIWPHFNDEPRVQEKQQVKDQQSQVATRDTKPRRDYSIPYMGR